MRTRYSAEQKAKLVLETLRGERTVQQIASENNIAPNLLTRWKNEAVSRANGAIAFSSSAAIDGP